MTRTITQDTIATALKPTAAGWAAEGLSDIIFRGVTFKSVRLTGAVNVSFESCRFEGDAGAPVGIGLEVVGTDRLPVKNLKVLKSTFTGLKTGAKLVNGDGLLFIENELTAIQADGVIYSGQTNYKILRNSFADWRKVGTKHCDAIQAVKPDAYNKPSIGGLIQGNTIVARGIQAILVHKTIDTEIRDNFIAVDLAIAIGVGSTVNAKVLGNRIGTYPPSTTIARVDAREAVGLVTDDMKPAPYRWRTA